ncbi:hypothetical protein M8C21_012973, partial [Ambrosia artemisiifolia]
MTEEIKLNGDVYSGNVKGKIPHGMGKYTWSDGTVYDGNWEDGKMSGRGQILWPSGTSYEGDFSGGYLHGFGTLTKPDGSVYKGSWRLNIENGLGRKQYSNSDVYDGCWKDGVHEGSGKYAWSNGNIYIGNWKAGKMCGRGVMKWLNGDLFDGSWSNGHRHGSGVYRFANGSYYFGTWTKGLKDGQGTLYAAGSKCKSQSFRRFDKKKGLVSDGSSGRSEKFRDVERSVGRSLSEKISFNGFFRDSSRMSSKRLPPEEDCSIGDSAREFSIPENTEMLSHISDEGESELDSDSTVAWEREYMQGVLMKERVKNNAGLSSKSKQPSKLHENEVKPKSCVDIFEGHKSYWLMLNLQLGIRYTVGKITPVPMREVRSSDFGERARIRMYFPRKGSQFTPPHYSVDFYWKDYCPMVFRDLSIPPKGLLLVTHEPSSVNTAPGPHIRGSTLRAFSVGDKEVDLLLPGTARLRVQLGVNMPAQANRKVSQDVSDSAEVELFEPIRSSTPPDSSIFWRRFFLLILELPDA